MPEPASPSAEKLCSSEQSDALAFTSGAAGLSFGLGVIHAYLAADRKPRVLLAGISSGALATAAMQRC